MRVGVTVNGRLQEHEVEQRTEIAGAIAQRWLRYEKRGTLDGKPLAGAGHKAMQFVRTSRGWKIAALAWSDESSIGSRVPIITP